MVRREGGGRFIESEKKYKIEYMGGGGGGGGVARREEEKQIFVKEKRKIWKSEKYECKGRV